jgi:hypothetical protein
MKLREQFDVEMCLDCAMWHANGDLPDQANAERCREITNPMGISDSDTGELFSCVVAVCGEETFFSWASCDLCECVDGGDRVPGVVVLI